MFFLAPDRTNIKRVLALAALLGLYVLARYTVGTVRSQAAATTELKPVSKADTPEKKLALTFNVTWGNKIPLQILDILKQKEVKVTFFTVGPWVAANPELARRIIAEGHEMGSLGYSSVAMTKLKKEEIAHNLAQADTIISQVTGRRPSFFRPPGGKYNTEVIAAAMEKGYLTVIWDTDSFDSLNPGPSAIVKNVVDKAGEGSIVLLHANDTSIETAEALPAIIDGLRQKGYEMLTVGQLLTREEPD